MARTLTEAELNDIASLPFGPNGKASVKYLMLSRDLSFEDAVFELERLANAPGSDAMIEAGKNRSGKQTGVR